MAVDKAHTRSCIRACTRPCIRLCRAYTAVFTILYWPRSRPRTGCVHGRLRAVYTNRRLRTQPCRSSVGGRVHVYTARTRPCSRRVHGRVHVTPYTFTYTVDRPRPRPRGLFTNACRTYDTTSSLRPVTQLRYDLFTNMVAKRYRIVCTIR